VTDKTAGWIEGQIYRKRERERERETRPLKALELTCPYPHKKKLKRGTNPPHRHAPPHPGDEEEEGQGNKAGVEEGDRWLRLPKRVEVNPTISTAHLLLALKPGFIRQPSWKKELCWRWARSRGRGEEPRH
jgi:hypothetical protein